jgi:MarR family transcriptional regulator, organic hydroperoxide resistance regulator
MEHNKIFAQKGGGESPGFLLWQVSTLWRRHVEDILLPLRLSHPEFVVLATSFWLKRTQEHVRQSDIAKQTKLSNMHVSKTLRALEKKLLIQRLAHAGDTRAKSIVVSREGLILLRQAVKQVEVFDQQFFAALGLQSAEFGRLLGALIV